MSTRKSCPSLVVVSVLAVSLLLPAAGWAVGRERPHRLSAGWANREWLSQFESMLVRRLLGSALQKISVTIDPTGAPAAPPPPTQEEESGTSQAGQADSDE